MNHRVLDLTQQRRARGVASDLDVERVRTQVENTRAAIIPLDAEIVECLDQLAVLTSAHVEQAKAGFDEAEAKYESVVLRALKDANGALSRYGHQRESVVSLRKVEASAMHSATLTEQRYRAGTTSALDWLDSERTRFSAEQNRISAEAQLIQDFVSLQKSLGLGWQPRGTGT
jgi:outer membrane protein TolC